MNDDFLYLIALSFVPQVGPIGGRNLISYCGSAQAVFQKSTQELTKIPGIGEVQANSIKSFKNFKGAEEELKFCQKQNIQLLPYHASDYPKRLKRCYDSPLLLYYKGNASLDAEKTVCIIGTRKCTPYGKDFVQKLCRDLANSGILVFSGLAYGIDIQAHQSALENNLATVGVMAHGHDRLYPAVHKPVVREMMQNGGLLTQFPSGTNPDRENFPSRNRIVAGLSDACIVVESDFKGGAMITAEIAQSYNRDVFAVPGAVSSKASKGTHHLIKSNQAFLMESAEDLIFQMGWKQGESRNQTQLALDITEVERQILTLFEVKSPLHIDELLDRCALTSSQLSLCLLELELKGLMKCLPGKMYAKIG